MQIFFFIFFPLCTLQTFTFLRFIIIDEHVIGTTRLLGGECTLDSSRDTLYEVWWLFP